MVDQLAQVSLILISRNLVCPCDGVLPQRLCLFACVGAAAVVTAIANALIIVAHECGNIPLTNGCNDLIGKGAITDQVTQSVQRIHFLLVDVGEYGFQRRQVAVDITKDRYTVHLSSFWLRSIISKRVHTLQHRL